MFLKSVAANLQKEKILKLNLINNSSKMKVT